MDYYSSNYYDSYVGEDYQTPYGGNYDIVPSQEALTAHSGHGSSSQSFFDYDSTPYYGAYDPAMNHPVFAYSVYTYSEPKSIVYDLYNGGYSAEAVTQFRVSYSVSEANDIDFEEYDPTPYQGGCDLDQTYGKPLPHSEATCYPRSKPDSGAPPLNGFAYGSIESPYGKEIFNESAQKPHMESEKTPAKEEQQQDHASSGDQVEEYKTNHVQDDETQGSDHGSGYDDESNNYEYDKRVPQIPPPGYGLEAMDLCEGLFGYWPCLAKYNKRAHECQQFANGENSCFSNNQWKEAAADYLFGSSHPYEEARYGDIIYSYHRHHQPPPLHRQVEFHEQNPWMSNNF